MILLIDQAWNNNQYCEDNKHGPLKQKLSLTQSGWHKCSVTSTTNKFNSRFLSLVTGLSGTSQTKAAGLISGFSSEYRKESEIWSHSQNPDCSVHIIAAVHPVQWFNWANINPLMKCTGPACYLHNVSVLTETGLQTAPLTVGKALTVFKLVLKSMVIKIHKKGHFIFYRKCLSSTQQEYIYTIC